MRISALLTIVSSCYSKCMLKFKGAMSQYLHCMPNNTFLSYEDPRQSREQVPVDDDIPPLRID